MDKTGNDIEGTANSRHEFRFSPRPNRAHEIEWNTWAEEVFERAEEEGKPVLLSISAVWCHWCHVMDETSYSDPAVIDLINRKYVAVRVDSDRNPDINSRYNQGGWPTTAFLDPKGTLLAGATYIPPETLRAALERISELYSTHEIEVTETDDVFLHPTELPIQPDLRVVEEAGAMILRSWDRAYGGMGREPKFPQTESLALALDLYGDEGLAEYLDFARTTLEAMIRGNLLDKVEGGFFRYSTTRDWSIPHYEKMLADNTGLIHVLLSAYAMTGAEIFKRTASETAAYIYRNLSDGESRFYGSQDADEEYYLMKGEDRKHRPSPPVDTTVYTDQAARAAASFLLAGTTLERDEYVSLALSSLDFLWSESFRPGDGMAHYHDGKPHRWGLLDDGIETAAAFSIAYGYTGDGRYLERAQALLRLAVEHHWDEEKSVFLDTADEHVLPGLKPQPADPGSQARAVDAMLVYWAYSGEDRWRNLAARSLSVSSGLVTAYGVLAAPFALAMNLFMRGPVLVKVSGDSDKAVTSFVRTALLSPRPRIIPMVSKKVGRIEEGVLAEVCTTRACQFKTGEIEALAEHLEVREDITKGVMNDARGLPG